MRVIYQNLPSKRISCVTTLGVFDGVHTGHQLILKGVKKNAQRCRALSCVITFDRLPEEVLHTSSNYQHISHIPGFLTSMSEKTRLLASFGLDYIWFLKTTPSLLRLSAQEFIKFIVRYLRIKEFIVGEDFRFGYLGKGDISFLKHIGQKNNFAIHVVKKRKIKGHIVSSSLIRTLVAKGAFKKARTYLGHDYSLEARVIPGKGLGNKLGFPTANLSTKGYLIPGQGVYATRVRALGKTYIGAVNIGRSPTAGVGSGVLTEAHIIGFRGRLVNKTIIVTFLDKIRNEKKFSTLAHLAEAIHKDVNFISRNYHLPK
jgi:riboflavin kinase/FMN adenylyltransferase